MRVAAQVRSFLFFLCFCIFTVATGFAWGGTRIVFVGLRVRQYCTTVHGRLEACNVDCA